MSIDKVPNEILQNYIFSYLSIDELLTCRLVDKRFLANVNDLNLKSFFVYDSTRIQETGLLNNLKNFLNYDKEIGYQHYVCLPIDKEFNLMSLFKFSFFANLKELYFVNDLQLSRPSALKDILSNLKRLTVLEIDFTINFYNQINGNIELELDELRLLSISCTSEIDDDFKVIINAPKLQKLKVSSYILYDFELVHPQSITNLEVDFYVDTWMNDLVNLEILTCINIGDLEVDSLNCLSKLKELHFYKPGLSKLKIMKENHTGNAFKIYFCDVLFDDKLLNNPDDELVDSIINSPDRFVDASQKHYSLNVLMQRHPKISSKLCVESIIYNILEEFFYKIPKSFTRKLVHLNSLTVSNAIQDANQFKEFLQCFKTLNYLKLKSIGLSQEFYSDELVKCVPFVKILSIQDSACVDFTFLLKFKNPNKFRIDQNLPNLEIVIECMQKFYKDHHFSQFKFFYSNSKCKVTIDKEKSKYKLTKGRKFYYNTDIVDLVSTLIKNRNHQDASEYGVATLKIKN